MLTGHKVLFVIEAVLPMFSIKIMAAKELKAFVDIGTPLGYSADELKQFNNEERITIDREKEEREKAI